MVVDPHNYKVPKSLRNIINRNLFEVTINKDFGAVIVNCQKITRKDQEGTWISTDVVNAYNKLHKLGKAMSFEVWQEGKLVGGLYGVDLGHVFCGESMFSKVPNASKVAFVKLIEYLKQNNYKLLDCQVHNDHLERLGAFEISREIFMRILKDKS
jgi:leucyl/phenylalanyl-tRNA--protein transferase